MGGVAFDDTAETNNARIFLEFRQALGNQGDFKSAGSGVEIIGMEVDPFFL
jgi:hypothetical protein